MKRKFTLIIALMAFSLYAKVMLAQQTSRVSNWLQAQKSENPAPIKPNLFSRKKPVLAETQDHTLLRLDSDTLQMLNATHISYLKLDIPFKNSTVHLEMAETTLNTPDFEVRDAQTNQLYSVQQGKYFRGIVDGEPGSIAALAVFPDQVIGVISTPAHGNLTIGRLPDQPDQQAYVIYADNEVAGPEFNCATDESTLNKLLDLPISPPESVSGCVRMALEVDYNLYQYNGSNVQSTVNYINGLMNVVATVFQNETVSITVSQMFIWTTPYDYPVDIFVRLDEFVNFRNSFNGDLAHLITALPGGGAVGGAAWIDALCSSGARHGVSDILETYNQLPTFSYTVNVIAHETGHNLGSPHTHNCSWPGGAIDDCSAPEGSCPTGPAGQPHTVMSYCPFPSLNGGFGTLPGNLIRSKVQSAACLAATCTTPACPAPTNFTIVGTPLSTSCTLSWTPGTGNTTYNIQYGFAGGAGGWNTISGVTSPYTLNGLLVDTDYEVLVQGVCGNGTSLYSTGIIFHTRCNKPGALASSNITQTGATLAWQENNASNSWEIKYGPNGFDPYSAGTAVVTTNNPHLLTGLSANTSYQWYVRSTCIVSSTGYSDYAGPGSFMTLAGDICTWNGSTNGWNASAANWSCGHIPTPNDNVVVNSGTVLLNSNVVVNALTLTGGVIGGNFNLTVTNNLIHNGGSITGTGTCTVNGQYLANTPNNSLTSLSLLDKNFVFNEGGLINNARIFIRAGNSFTIAANKTLTWNATLSGNEMIKQSSATPAATWILNSGSTLNKTGGATLALRSCNFTNQGTIKVESNGSGLEIAHQSGTANTHQNGAFDIASGTEIIIFGGTHNMDNCTIGGGGLFTSGSSILNFSSSTTINPNTAINAWGGTTWNLNNFNATVRGFRIVGTVQGMGNITATDYLHMDGAPNYTATGDLVSNGNMSIFYGTCTVGGTGNLVINGNLELILQSGVSVPTILALNRNATITGNLSSNSSINALTIGANQTLNFIATSNQTASGTGTITINGTLRKSGGVSSLLISMNTNTSTGGALEAINGTIALGSSSNVNSGVYRGTGIIQVTGSLSNTGTFAPGLSPGTLGFIGAYTNSTLHFEIQESGGTVSKDLLNITGNMTLGGTLNIQHLGGNVPPGTYDIATCTGTRTGTFATINYPANCNGNCSVVYTANKAQLVLTAVLPLELLRFTARPKEEDVLLEWHTSNETGVRNFDIERSTDGLNWTQIAIQTAKNIPTTQQQYQYTDANALLIAENDNHIYYRLKINDLDGKFEYSPMAYVLVNRHEGLQVWPNPATADVTVVHNASREIEQELRVYSSDGKLVFSQMVASNKGMNQWTIPTNGWPSGVYRVALGEKSLVLVKQ